MDAPVISVRGLTKRYGKRTAVDHLDLDVPPGVVAGFVGPNGAGKTTTMAMLLGLVRPTSGTGVVLGQDIGRPAGYLPRVGALVEGPAFYPALSGIENLEVFARVGGHRPAVIPELLEVVGLAGRGDDRYRGYSLGMKQRLGVAAALLGDPELLVLDEPANGLDPGGVREMRSLVRRIAGRGRTVLVSSHDLSELEQICDWLILIDAGRCIFQGPADRLLDGAASSLVVSTERADDLTALHGVVSANGERVRWGEDCLVIETDERDVDAVAARINGAAFDAGIVLNRLAPLRATLEDRYLEMVRGGSR